MLYEQEQSEFDDSLSRYIKKVIEENFPDRSLQPYASDSTFNSKLSLLASSHGEELLPERCLAAIHSPEDKLLPEDISPAFKTELQAKLAVLKNKFLVQRLFTPSHDILLYRLQEKENEQNLNYTAFAFITIGNAAEENLQKMEKVFFQAAAAVAAYQQAAKGQENRIEIMLVVAPLFGKQIWKTPISLIIKS